MLCHATCLTCNGALINNCLSCDGTLPLCLNDNTCNANCLTNYGVTADPSLCVLCSNRCILCSYVADNCSSCTTSGPNKSYLYDDLTTSPKCVANCPVGYFNNNTALTCDLCDPTCSACSTTSTFCTTCVTGYGFYNNKCYQPCDDGFYLSNSGQNCTKCSGYCVLCNGTSTNCSVCTLTGTYMSYLSVNSCVTSCPTGTYPDTNNTFGPNLCLPCDVSCSACTGSPSPCSECNTPYFFFNGTCVLTCPTDYKQNLVNRHC